MPRPAPARPRPILRGVLVAPALLLLGLGAAWAQGQDSVTSPMGPHMGTHPPPLLSSISAVSVPSGKEVPPLPIPVARPKGQGDGLALPASLQLASPDHLACGDIGDRKARARCEARKTPPAPPAEGTP